jgi:hypothetical protein
MRTLATIVLSLVAIAASLVLVLSTVCAFTGGFSGSSDRSSYVLCAIVSSAVIALVMLANSELNRRS